MAASSDAETARRFDSETFRKGWERSVRGEGGASVLSKVSARTLAMKDPSRNTHRDLYTSISIFKRVANDPGFQTS